MFLLGRPVARG